MPLLFPNHPDIGHEIRSPVPPFRIDGSRLHAVEIWAGSDREHAIRVHSTARDRYPTVQLVGGDGYVSDCERQPLEQNEYAPQHAAATKLSFEEFWIEVVMIE